MAAATSPMADAVGEEFQKCAETSKYADIVRQKSTATALSKIELLPVKIDHRVPMIEFTREEVNSFIREEGLHQAAVMKFSYGKPDLHEIRKNFSTQFDVQGNCNVGQLEFRHVLIRFDLYNDYVKFLSKSTGIFKSKGDEFFFRTFPWTLEFNPREETSMAVVWISFPGLPPNFFAKRSLMSIASAVGKALTVDKATQERTRPSAARVKVILDLLDKHPRKIKLHVVDRCSGKHVVYNQEVVYDNLPKYCTVCKHQGHDEKVCRFMKERANKESIDEDISGDCSKPWKPRVEKLQGDAREFLNAKRASKAVNDTTVQATVPEATGKQSAFVATQFPNGQGNEKDQHGTQASDRGGEKQAATAGAITSHVHFLEGETQNLRSKKSGNNAVYVDSKHVDIITDHRGEEANKRGDLWNETTSKKSTTKKDTSMVSPNVRQNSFRNVTSLNKFEVLELEKIEQPEVTIHHDSMKSITRNNTGQEQQSNHMVVRNLDIQQVGLDKEDHSSKPLVHFSSPNVERIIKDAQAAMMQQTNMVRQPLVTLNTSIFQIPSQSEQSFGENEGESGQLLLSTGNNNDIDPNVTDIDRKSQMITRARSWVDQDDDKEEDCEDYEDENDYSEALSSEEEDYENVEEEVQAGGSPSVTRPGSTGRQQISSTEIARSEQQKHENATEIDKQQITTKIVVQNAPVMTKMQYQKKKLDINASAFIPSDQQQSFKFGTSVKTVATDDNRPPNKAGQIQSQTRNRGSQVTNRVEKQHGGNRQVITLSRKELLQQFNQSHHTSQTGQMQYIDSNLLPGQQQKIIKPIISNVLGNVEALYEQYTDATLLAISQDEQEIDERGEKDAAIVSSTAKDRTTGVVAESKPIAGQQNFVQKRANSSARKQQRNRARHQQVFPLFEDKQTSQTSETG